jgi:hypothetical protein
MGQTKDLVPLGLVPELAKRLGWEIQSKTTTASTQGSAGGLLTNPGNKLVLANVAGASGAITMPSNADIGDMVLVSNITATAGLIFPQTGGTLQNAGANASAALPANGSMLLVKATATNWRTHLSA